MDNADHLIAMLMILSLANIGLYIQLQRALAEGRKLSEDLRKWRGY